MEQSTANRISNILFWAMIFVAGFLVGNSNVCRADTLRINDSGGTILWSGTTDAITPAFDPTTPAVLRYTATGEGSVFPPDSPPITYYGEVSYSVQIHFADDGTSATLHCTGPTPAYIAGTFSIVVHDCDMDLPPPPVVVSKTRR